MGESAIDWDEFAKRVAHFEKNPDEARDPDEMGEYIGKQTEKPPKGWKMPSYDENGTLVEKQ